MRRLSVVNVLLVRNTCEDPIATNEAAFIVLCPNTSCFVVLDLPEDRIGIRTATNSIHTFECMLGGRVSTTSWCRSIRVLPFVVRGIDIDPREIADILDCRICQRSD